jgi:hypothetical protein
MNHRQRVLMDADFRAAEGRVSLDRRLALERFVRYYNQVRLSRGIVGRTPRGRLTEKLPA